METTIADEMLSIMGRRLSVHEPAQIFDPHVVGLSFVVRNVEEVDVCVRRACAATCNGVRTDSRWSQLYMLSKHFSRYSLKIDFVSIFSIAERISQDRNISDYIEEGDLI